VVDSGAELREGRGTRSHYENMKTEKKRGGESKKQWSAYVRSAPDQNGGMPLVCRGDAGEVN